MSRGLSWLGIVRLGIVQAAIGAVVVFATSTLNRIMVVELALPAMVPGSLVALHYAVQMARPRWGHGSDRGGRRTPWIVGGMAVLCAGAVLAATATALMAAMPLVGGTLAVLGFVLIGIGVGAAGTSLLVLLAKQVDGSRRAAAATIVWMMMIVGFVVTAGVAGHLLDPFSTSRLLRVAAVVAGGALLAAALAIWGVEDERGASPQPSRIAPPSRAAFRPALREVWADAAARRFTFFVFFSMLAYSAQELIVEPFAGLVFGLTPAESAGLAGLQHTGLLVGMVLVAVLGSAVGGPRLGSMRGWTVAGCLASALAISGLAATGLAGGLVALRVSIVALGIANGIFSIAAVGAMMQLAGVGAPGRDGVRMGLWGAAQAMGFALGGLVGTGASDLGRHLFGTPAVAYMAVFIGEAMLFGVAAGLAARAFPRGAARALSTEPAEAPQWAS